jgi:hypothetical protein
MDSSFALRKFFVTTAKVFKKHHNTRATQNKQRIKLAEELQKDLVQFKKILKNKFLNSKISPQTYLKTEKRIKNMEKEIKNIKEHFTNLLT